jgi:DNA-binding transcriptional LysR family regulator
MNYRINDLENFIETANCRTMAMAARKLDITQPSLSESIKRLEQDLRTVLFYRSRSGIQLTMSGRTVLENAKKAISSLSLVDSISKTSTVFNGRTVIIGCHSVVASFTLPTALQKLAKTAPDYRVQIKHGSSREIQSLVQDGRVDIGIVINPNPVPDIVIKKLGIDRVSVWSSPNTKTFNKLICNTENFQTQNILKKWKNYPTEIIDTDSYDLSIRLVEKGIGYGIIPERAVKLLGAHIKKCEQFPSYEDTIGLIFRPEFGKNVFEKEIISSIVETFRD